MGKLKNSIFDIIDRLKKSKPLQVQPVNLFGKSENSEKLPGYPEWFFSARLGQPRRVDIIEIRNFAQSPWCQMAINTIKKEISHIPYKFWIDVQDSEDDDLQNYSEEMKLINDFFKKCNSNNESIYDLMAYAITDVAEIDAGVWVKVFSNESYQEQEVQIVDEMNRPVRNDQMRTLKEFGKRDLKMLWPADGATFLFDIDMYKRIRGFWQYSIYRPNQYPTYFFKDEACYFQMNKRPYSLYGFSPIEGAQQEIELMIQSTRYNKEYFVKNMIPDAVVGFEEANEDSLKQIKTDWQTQVQGKPHKLMFVNMKPYLEILSRNNQEMQWIESQRWYYHIILAQFGLSPAEVGFHEDVNRSTQEGQERVTVRNAIKPYLHMFERVLNNDIIPELLKDQNSPLKIKFVPFDHEAELSKFDQDMRLVENGVMTINEYRRERGLEDVSWGDEPMQQQSFSFDGNSFGQPRRNQVEEEEEPEEKTFTKSREPEDDLIRESKSYDDFIAKNFKSWEGKAIAAVNKLEISYKSADLLEKEQIYKTFGEFLEQIFNTINAKSFTRGMKKFIGNTMEEGKRSADEDAGKKLDTGIDFDRQLNKFIQEELDGYSIPNGQKWHGIKGVTAQMRLDILVAVKEGMDNKENHDQIKSRIKDIFKMATDVQAERIARTETTRFFNQGKISTFKDSGIKGKKRWLSIHDDRTSELCDELNDKYFNNPIPFDEPFRSSSGLEFMYPPAHVNCRSAVGLVLDKEES